MTREEILINFLNIEQPTTKQIIEAVKVLIKKDLKITDDLFEINSLTGQRVKKISTKPIQIDPASDLSLIKLEISKEVSKQIDEKLIISKELK